jgi:hypothetical protein
VLIEKTGYAGQALLINNKDGSLSLGYNNLITLLTKVITEQHYMVKNQNKIFKQN